MTYDVSNWTSLAAFEQLNMYLYKKICSSIVLLAAFASMNTYANYRVDASESIPSADGFTYQARNLIRRDINEAWCTNREISEKIWWRIQYKKIKQLSGIVIINGYSKNKKTYLANSRPKSLVIYVDGARVEKKIIADTSKPQWLGFRISAGKEYKFVVEDVYKGSKYSDICVTYVFDDRRLLKAYDYLIDMDTKYGSRALTPNQIKTSCRPIYEDFYRSYGKIHDVKVFYASVLLRASRRDTRGLRLLLDLTFYSNKYRGVIDAELLEGLRDFIVPFIEKDPDVVMTVLKDPNQVERNRIESAFYQFVDQFSWGQDIEEIADERFTKKHKTLYRYIRDNASELNRMKNPGSENNCC